MKMKEFLSTKAGAVVALGAVVGVIGYFAQKKATDAVIAAGNAVNPVNNDNIFYSGVNAIGEKVTGKSFSLGNWLYNKTHGE